MNIHNAENHNLDVDVALYRNEIMYDVNFASNRIARLRLSGDDVRKASLITTESSSSDSKIDYIDRQIVNALTVVQQKLKFAINHNKSRLRTGLCDAHLDDKDVDDMIPSNDQSFGLSFSFEEGWKGSPQVLCNFIHSYIVNSILTDWFTLTLPDESVIFKAKADEDLKGLVHEGRCVIPVGVHGFYL